VDRIDVLVIESPDPLVLAGAICARICHDMAGTLGALSGMLDMQHEDGADSDTLEVARSCARDLTLRLRLLRAAWGGDSEVPDLAVAVVALPNAERLRVDMGGLPADQEEAMRRLCVSLLIVAAGALPRGGTITLAGGTNALSLMIEGQRAAWPALLLAQDLRTTDLRSVSAAMVCLQARSMGLAVRVVSPTVIEVG